MPIPADEKAGIARALERRQRLLPFMTDFDHIGAAPSEAHEGIVDFGGGIKLFRIPEGAEARGAR